jgi:Zn-dependent protease with chaperone function
VIDANWYDGQTSRSRPVRLAAAEGSLQLDFGDGEKQQWPLEAVTINQRLGSTPRVLRLPDGARVEAPDSELLQRWFGSGGSRIEAFADWLERRRLAIAGAAVVTVAATVLFVQFGVPWLAREVAERMPATVERHVSGQVVELLERTHFSPSRVPAARRETLQRRFQDLVAGAPRRDDLRLTFVRAPAMGPNAFALPDGRIYMTDELVDLAGSDEELLAVLAHEAGHHVHRHGMRQAIESSSVFVLAGMLFGDVSGSSLAVSVPAVLLSNGFSRGHEREADAYAFALLREHGQSPAAFAAVMRRLSAELPAGLEEGPVGYLSTHPPTPERIAAAEQAAQQTAQGH